MSASKRGKRLLQVEVEPPEMIKQLDAGTVSEELINTYKRALEDVEGAELSAEGVPEFVYPPLTDPTFNTNIVLKKEFADLRSDTHVYDPELRAIQLCDSQEFELLPHQAFVRNFLSFRTPYNGLLLFHGLGTGKTCSAISVTEEMRLYLRQIGVQKRIIVVASPNVQDNFRRQLFDERRLEKRGTRWSLKSCAGDEMLQEINPTGMTGLDRATIIKLVKQIIRRSYLFMGPEQFSNYISRVMERYAHVEDDANRKRLVSNGIRKEFSNRLLVIDEVHNIRVTRDSPQGFDKKGDKVAKYLHELVQHTDNLKLLLMSATPMFNSPEEIVWLINLLRLNDKRPPLLIGDVFTPDGVFKDRRGVNLGRHALVTASRGYVSYVRGDNPYTFPFKLLPKQFAPEYSLSVQPVARRQLNGAPIIQPLEYLDLYAVNPQGLQYDIYLQCVDAMAGRIPEGKGIGYQALNLPLQALDIVFPILEDDDHTVNDFIGRSGLQNTFTYDPETKRKFAYRHDVLDRSGRFLSMPSLGKYSAKIASVCEAVMNSTGIILVYSQYIDGGCVPVALALEEMGLRRTVGQSLYAEPPAPVRDALTMKVGATTNPATYALITGDKLLSPDNAAEVRKLTNLSNASGMQVKVVIISEAGSEGIDLTNIRQVHILDPWYNLNRLEQIVGRAVRWCSHSKLPFPQRNVEIRYYGSVLQDNEVEAADVYVYRLAERKAVKVGAVTRALKETAVDCLLNKSVLTPDRVRKTVTLSLSSGSEIEYRIGDRAKTSLCDFMDDCEYTCEPEIPFPEHPSLDTYTDGFVTMNIGAVEKRIADLFLTGYAYTRGELIRHVNARHDYPLVQVDAAITRVLAGQGPSVVDMLDRTGRMVNVGEYYLFQPADLVESRISMYERRVPIPNKPSSIKVVAEQRDIAVPDDVKRIVARLERQYTNTQREHDYQKIQWTELDRNGKRTSAEKQSWSELNATINTAEYASLGKYQDFYREIRTDLDWHKMLGNALNKDRRLTAYIDLTAEDVLRYTTDHVLDTTSLPDKLRLHKYLATNHSTPFEIGLLAAFVRRQYNIDGVTFLVMADPNNGALSYYTVTNGVAQEATPVERLRVTEYISLIPTIPLAPTIGLMVPTKSDGYVVFKVRDTSKPRAQGYRCDQKGKRDTIRSLNAIIGRNAYVDIDGEPKNAKELCVDEELVLRHFDAIAHQGQRWFLGLEESIRTNLGRKR